VYDPPAADRLQPLRPEEVGFSVRHYELMVILDPDLEERTIAPSLDRFLTVVTNSGGTVKTEIWGRRRLAYEIRSRSRASTPSSTSRPRPPRSPSSTGS
jgi:hypothetical protein